MQSTQFFGEAGIGRNPHVGEMVRFRQSPDVRGRITAERIDTSGRLVWRVEWESGPVDVSSHPGG